MAGIAADDPETKGKEATKDVVKRITEVMDDHHYEPSPTLRKEMPVQYEPGFIEAHRQNKDFWKVHKEKVLRMASYAAAFSCYLVERSPDGRTPSGQRYGEVGVDEWLMAMGIVRSACLIRRKGKAPEGEGHLDPRGIPCNRVNFPITTAIKKKVAFALTDIVADLMVSDPVRRR